ncbi:hypothetical protein SAMN05443550_10427 [Pedobacter hartonius]|uniref:Uncharacterized protein n=1 Tax=Pedobacter hartonius TaxID=425514 RepID=A0A1H4CEW1_9SPHI|nr:hypothetical protein SAMN05443550_10427 [Pedobacter hartonius]
MITGGKSSQALKLLKAFTENQVLLADYGETPSFSSAQYQFISLGDRNEDTTAHNLLSVCLDQEADCLLPLYIFELEAVVKSLILFEEFNIHVLLPDLATFPLYPLSGASNTQSWAVYNRGELIYASAPELQPGGNTVGLNGVFYIDQTPEGIKRTLFTVS